MIRDLIMNPHLEYIAESYLSEWAKNPHYMAIEHLRFLANLVGWRTKPVGGVRFETHCHTTFSDGPDLTHVIDHLFDMDIRIVSIKDHGNSNAFDWLASGRYKIGDHTHTKRSYTIDVNKDGRSMIIHTHGNKRIVLLRAIEYMTNKGEIGVDCYAGDMPDRVIPVEDAIKMAHDMGGYVTINHQGFWQGLGFHGIDTIRRAAELGADAIEMNGVEIPPEIFSPAATRSYSERFKLRLVGGGDAHTLDMLGLSGLVFDPMVYSPNFENNGHNHADTVKHLVVNGDYKVYINYVTPRQFLSFFHSMGGILC